MSPTIFNPYRYAGGVEECQDISDQDTVMQQWNGSSGNKLGAGCLMTNSGKGADFMGLEVTKVGVWLKKSAGAPDNSFSVGIFREASKTTELFTFHSGDLSTVTTSMVYYEFTAPSGSHTIATGDIVGIKYPHNGSSLYSRIEYGKVYGGLIFGLLGGWDAPPHDYWTFDSNSSGLTFCVS